ncbi:MAG: type VI secretion system protein TssA [Fibrobacteria bacterium]|nr:type VI secretion system protein TssA [Fibrobacteria bacterium]
MNEVNQTCETQLTDTRDDSGLANTLIHRISELAPCGEDPKYTPEFESIKAEIEKSTGADYNIIRDNADSILTNNAKDIRVFNFYLLASVKTEGFSRFADILGAFHFFLEQHFDIIHPQRPVARINAFKWLNQEKVIALLSQGSVSREHHDVLKKGLDSLNKIKEIINNRFPDSPPSIKGVLKLVEAWVSESQPEEKPLATVQATPPSSPPPPAAVSTVVSAIPGAGDQLTGGIEDKSAAKILLQKTAQFYLEQETHNPLSYTIMRALKWQEIAKSPVVENGRLKIPGPNTQMISFYPNLVETKNWMDIVKKGESAFTRPGMHFWLDLQFYICLAFKNLGEEYSFCQSVIERELLALILRVPSLLEIQFQDGTPLASSQTLSWIESIQAGSSSTGEESSSPKETSEFLEGKSQAVTLANEGKYAEAIQLIQKIPHSGEIKTIMEKQFILAELSYMTGENDIAESLIEDIQNSTKNLSVGVWDSAFYKPVLNLSIKVCKSLLDKLDAKNSAPERRQELISKIKESHKKLSCLDPVFAKTSINLNMVK